MSRENCPLRHENGNCLCIGGFCTAVKQEYCDAVQEAYQIGKKSVEIVHGIAPSEELRLAVQAGARAIEFTKKYHGTIYVEDVFAENQKTIAYLQAAQVLRQFAYMLEKVSK